MRKRKGRRRRGPRRAWLWLPLLGGLVLLGGILAALFVSDALVVRRSLTAAQASLSEVQAAAGTGDMTRASDAVRRAERELATARSRTSGPLWGMAANLPVVRHSVHTTRAVVGVASATTELADTAVERGERLIGSGLDVRVEDGRLDLAPLLEARDILNDLSLERLSEARTRLAEAGHGWMPQELVDGREQSLTAADQVLDLIGNGQQLLSALPGFVGAEEPRRYFLGVQTPAELRGTGGLIGYYAVLQVEDGRFELLGSDVYDALDDGDSPATGMIGQLHGEVTQAATVDPEFAERYGHVAAAGHFSNVNVDPDFPTTADVALNLYEVRTGESLDGMILIDPIAMEYLLTAMGTDLELPPDVAGQVAGDIEVPASLSPEQFSQFVTADVYEVLGDGRSAERKLVLRQLGDLAFAQVIDGGWDGVAVARALADAASERHLQLFSRDEAEQTAFTQLGAAGAFGPDEGADFLSVTANNAVGGKQDVHLEHHVTANITLSDPRVNDEGVVTVRRDVDVRVEVVNPLPSDGMDLYVIGSCTPQGTDSGCFEGPPGENRTWFSVWAPRGSNLVTDDGAAPSVRTGQIRDVQVFDRFLATPPQDRAAFEFSYTGRAPASMDRGHLVYELDWWQQSKAIPTQLDLQVVAPEGWQVADVALDGRGQAEAVLARAGTAPAEARLDGEGQVVVNGGTTSDTSLVIRLGGIDLDE
ncbi:DUF4012 domain-containing protein [Egicoccus sp. AB-alg2]|uniref:DUF4012 domain-containing protein n=1 Tax=Egicoccus sp. AB-alg2 TaxID=3242693 RepID=UPI00359ED65B